MPSPVGHALAGVAAGYLAGGARTASLDPLFHRRGRTPTPRWNHPITTFAGLGVLADIDFLFGLHSAYTHSLGAIGVVAGLAAVMRSSRGISFSLAAAAAYGSHVLLDWLGSDGVAPVGIMALWPLSSDFFLSDRHWFMSVCREYWLTACWWHNARGLLHESLLLGPLAFGAVYLSRRHARVR